MIPKASQRGLGQDLATHLQNAYDNEYVEIAEVRGAVAHDLHGAFAEWEVCAHAMTGCRNYLYSLSVNPDPAQAALTRAQYRDYIDRVEGKLLGELLSLGLTLLRQFVSQHGTGDADPTLTETQPRGERSETLAAVIVAIAPPLYDYRSRIVSWLRRRPSQKEL